MSGNLPAVEREMDAVANPFLKTGLQLVVDLTPEEDILDLLHGASIGCEPVSAPKPSSSVSWPAMPRPSAWSAHWSAWSI